MTGQVRLKKHFEGGESDDDSDMNSSLSSHSSVSSGSAEQADIMELQD
jgi:hypothetical protein